MKQNLKNRVLTLALTLLAVLAGQSAWAAGTFTVTNTSGTSKFVITRTSNTSATETVYYRTVSLSAIAGQHFTDKYGSLTFDANNNTREVEIEEKTPNSDVYKYQTSTSRKYRFEVLDPGGFQLAFCDRTISSGLTKFSNTYLNKSITNLVYFNSSGNFTSDSGNKYLDVNFSMPSSYLEGSTGDYAGFALIDDSYDYSEKPATVSTNSLITSTGASSSYLNTLGYKIYATVCFTMKEKNDGYYYVQILNGTSSSSYDGSDENGVISNGPTNSIYKACFELQEGSGTYSGTGKAFFPHRYDYATPSAESNANIGITEFFPLEVNNKAGKLWQQKFKSNTPSYRANNSGSLVLDPTVANITTRFDCAGQDNDTWGYKDFFVRMALVDETAPTASGAKKVNGGRRSKGNTIYVSVPFSEIVTVSGTPTLTTTWGTLSYTAGSGSNVLTFSGTISDDASGDFTISGYNGTIKDLAGNSLSGTISGTLLTSYYLEPNYTYNITYDLAGGTVATANPSTYTYNTSTFTLNNPTRTGYTFNGWTGSNGTTPSTTVTIANHSHGDKSYTANWTAHTYTVSFNANGGSGTMSNMAFTYDVPQNLTANAFTRTGYTFAGWNTAANGNGDSYTDGQSVTNLTPDDGGTVNLYAQWTAHTYTVRFHSNDGTDTTSDQNFTYDTAQNLNTPFTRTGYTFDHWTTNADGSGDSYTDGQNVNNLTPVDGAIIDLYAQWTAHTYTLRLHHNDGTDDYTDQSMTYSTAANIQSISRTGYTFARWTTNADGSGTSYTDGQNVNNLTADDGEVIDLYAQWTANTYTVHFNRNEGTGTMSDQNLTYDAAQNLTANAFTRTGCTFAGWNTADNGTGDSYTDGEEVTNLTAENNGLVTLYAQWTDHWGITDGANGSEQHPYIITTTAGLDLLASDVNSGTDYSGKYFKLDADIAYDPNALDANGENYTAIGNINNEFHGTFDGDGHTISGIRINKTSSTNDDNCQGLFGSITSDGLVKNVVLSDARITGNKCVGGIAGRLIFTSTVENCLVLNTDITATCCYGGAIAGDYDYTAATLSSNYYHNCSVTIKGTTKTTDVGSNVDIDGARSVHSLILGTGVTASGESVTYQGTTYYASNTTITLNGTEGYTISGYSLNGTAIDGNTFTMPAADATVSATWTVIDYETGHAGTEADPYIIYNKDQLDMLATRVNSGSNYSTEVHFKLGADIVYDGTENNYTPIGNSSNKFLSTFDGDGHTISGININSSDNYQGLFGFVQFGTVKNVTLADARITGGDCVGGIAGYTGGSSTKIDNCLILNTAITAQSFGGVLVGYKYNGTYSHNFYRNCTVKVGSNTYTTNIGLGAPRNDFAEEVGSVHSITLPANVTATGESVVIDGITYYANKNTITLSYTGVLSKDEAPQFIVTKMDDNSVVAQTIYDFTMPAADVSISLDQPIKGYTLTLSDGITASGITTPGSDESDKYYLPGTIVTLSYSIPDGYSLSYTLNGTAIDGNTFTMPAADATVTISLTDLWGIADGADGSEQHPYIITTTAGLDLLATNVNSGLNEYGGKFFKLGNDIDYQPTTAWDDATSTEDNYTAIGNNNKAFCGTFDGQGHTVSGIRIYKSSTNYQGLFGRVYAGTVKNVIVSDSRINGIQYVGGISGQINGNTTIQDCLVLNTFITAITDCGAVVGYSYSSTTFIQNYYYNCSLTKNGTTRTTDIGVDSSDRDGARSVHTLTIGTDITATATVAVTHNNTDYYTAGTEVTLSYTGTVPDGTTVSYSYNDGSDHAITDDTFTMPASDITVSASLAMPAIAYIDAQGVERMCTNYTVLTSSNSYQNLGDPNNSEAWYVVNSDVTIGGYLDFIDDAAHLILCDGATLTVNGGDQDGISSGSNLTFYGQSGGTGNCSITSDGTGIYAGGSITINGGNVTATSNDYGIFAGGGNITINGGTVNATGNYGIYANQTVTINGGIVSATGNQYGILANSSGNNAITLGWKHASDRIYASSYFTSGNGKVMVKNSQFLTDGTDIYSGQIDINPFNRAVAGKTLMGVDVLFNNNYNNNTISNLNGKETNIYLNGRTLYKDGDWNTLCLPFSVTLSGSVLDGDNVDVRALSSSNYSNGTLTLNFTDKGDVTELVAGTPYIIKWSKSSDADPDLTNLVNPVFTNVTISNAMNDAEMSNVTFKGTYDPISFTEENKSILFVGDSNTLYWPENGASINAFRAYFQLNGLTAGSVTATRMFFGEDETTSINEELRMKNEEFAAAAGWFTLDGRKLNGRPTTKGLYIHGGKTVVIK